MGDLRDIALVPASPDPGEGPWAGTEDRAAPSLAREPRGGAATIESEPRLAAGTVIGDRFRIVHHVGTGSTSSVYAAADRLLGQRVALKIFPAAVAQDPDALRRLYDEVAVTRAITDSHVCRVYDVGNHIEPETCRSRPFLTMELVHGENLESLLSRGTLPLGRALGVARQICAGLRAAHDRGVLHRDLKPANVLVDVNDGVQLTDFGLARTLESEEVSNAGTPAAMAPEQLVGRGASVQSDLFSLGLLLYRLFTGQALLAVDTIEDLVRAHESFAPKSPRHLCPELDRRLAQSILNCLAVDPSRRPASAAVLERAVRRAQLSDSRPSLRQTLTTTLPALALAFFGLGPRVESDATLAVQPPATEASMRLACLEEIEREVRLLPEAGWSGWRSRLTAPAHIRRPDGRPYTGPSPWKGGERKTSSSVRFSWPAFSGAASRERDAQPRS